MDASGRRRSFAVGLCIVILGMISGRTTAGEILASNLGEDGSFGAGAYNLTGVKAATRVGYTDGVRFAVMTDGPVAFDSAVLPLAFRGGTNALDVVLMTDDNGVPGTALETIHLTRIPTNPTLVVASSMTHPRLYPSRSYWLVAVASNTTYVSWMINGFDEFGRFAYRQDTGRGPGPWRTVPGNVDPAFAITVLTGR